MSRLTRLIFYIIIIAFLLYNISRLQVPPASDSLRSQSPIPVEPETPPDEPPFAWLGTGDKGKLDFSQRPWNFPITKFRKLPAGKPKNLPQIQYAFKEEDAAAKQTREGRQIQVKKTFQRCWKAYKDHAWLQDELAPVSGGTKNTFGGWAATLIDALDTLWIMDMKDDFEAAVNAIMHVDFSPSGSQTINVFETTIRHLGGLLAAYDLSGDKRLIKKAVEIADMLYVAFDTPNNLPITRWQPEKAFRAKLQKADKTVLVAEPGSMTMEFVRLSQITRDPKYYDAVARVMDVFEYFQDKTNLPGMWPITVDVETPRFTGDNHFTLGGMADSLYEYFPKTYALLGGLSDLYEKFYEKSSAAAIQHLIFRPMTPTNADILVSGSVTASKNGHTMLNPEWQHLVCFAGGMFALGGRIFNKEDHVTVGRKVTDACIYTYKAFPFGIMPEISHMVPCPDPNNCTWNETIWHEHIQRHMRLREDSDVERHIAVERLQPGFTKIPDRRYILRPEAIESVFVLYRITGDEELMDAAWDMFMSIKMNTETELANAALEDVTVTSGTPPKMDSMESFWLAETLKYFYLIFSPPDLISLDDYVFNTEAHPFKIPK